jgi:hypothetical protein
MQRIHTRKRGERDTKGNGFAVILNINLAVKGCSRILTIVIMIIYLKLFFA